MGTNYYVREPEEDDLHMGKCSAGWAYALRVHPSLNINGLEDWDNYMAADSRRQIFDEYGRSVGWDEWIRCVTGRFRPESTLLFCEYSPPPEYEGASWQCIDRDFS